MSNLIMYVTDVHGEASVFEALLKQAQKKKPKAVIIGGDLCAHMTMMVSNSIEAQREFLEGFLVPLLRNFRKKSNIPVFMMFGNDDHSINSDVLEKAEKEGLVKSMHGKVHDLGKFKIVGCTYINPSDWLVFPINDWINTEKEIEKFLDGLTKDIKGDYILVTHAPPINTSLDLQYMGINVGSSAVRKIIEKTKPILGLHGHIHESPMISGEADDKVGSTLCVNPGNSVIIGIDLDDLKK